VLTELVSSEGQALQKTRKQARYEPENGIEAHVVKDIEDALSETPAPEDRMPRRRVC
jgi:hypothetical protein